jgi:hypothetical protein
MTMPRTLMFILALVPLGIIAVGCGGDTRRGETESTALIPTTTEPEVESHATRANTAVVAKVTDPARRAYVARLDSVCSRLDPERVKAQVRVAKSVLPKEAAKAYDDTIVLGRIELRKIEAVPVPPGEHELLQANVFEVVRRELALRGKISRALLATDLPRVRRLHSELDNLSRSLGGFARGYGFRVCGED